VTPIPPVHTRVGVTPPPETIRSWAFAKTRRPQYELDAAHDMFTTLARRLDGMGHILTRCALDADELLELACRATTLRRMRDNIGKIVHQLRLQVILLDTLVELRAHAPHYLPADDALVSRPARNLAWDARRLRALAAVVERQMAALHKLAHAPVQGPKQAYTVVFRNAINGVYETHGRNTRAEAEKLADEYLPFNNTAVVIETN
jgi:hypothetical protein